MLTVFAAVEPTIPIEEKLIVTEIAEQVEHDQTEALRHGMTLKEWYDYLEDLQLDAGLQ